MLELKISNADLLGRAVRPLIQRADEGIADYFPDEISLIVLDPEEFVHVARARNQIFQFLVTIYFVAVTEELLSLILTSFKIIWDLELHDEDSITITICAAGGKNRICHILIREVGQYKQSLLIFLMLLFHFKNSFCWFLEADMSIASLR